MLQITSGRMIRRRYGATRCDQRLGHELVESSFKLFHAALQLHRFCLEVGDLLLENRLLPGASRRQQPGTRCLLSRGEGLFAQLHDVQMLSIHNALD